VLESNYTEILEIYEEIEKEEQLEVFGPQIELSLENPSNMGEPAVEVAGVAPTIVVVEEESSVEVLEASASVEKETEDQAVRTGDELVLEVVKEKTGAEPVLMEVAEVRTEDEPIREAEELRTREEPVPADVELGTGDIPVRDVGEGDSHFEDYQGDDFEKVGEFTSEEISQSPSTPAPENPTEETPTSSEPRRKWFKTLAAWTDLPWVRKLIALRSKTSPSSQYTSQKQPSQPTRKSHRLAAQGFVRSSATEQGPSVIEEILSSSERSPIKTPAVPQDSPVLESE